MAYRLKRKESVLRGVRRIVAEQAAGAVLELTGTGADLREGIHNARKSLKKCRGLLRLVRDAMGEKRYKKENQWFREAKNRLSPSRDAEAIIETFDKLARRYPAVGRCETLAWLREGLVQRRDLVDHGEQELEQAAQETAELLLEVETRIGKWTLSKGGFDAVEPGLKRTYRRGRRAMYWAYRRPSDENFHEWRKRVKDHWYQSRLLSNVWPEMMLPRTAELKRLSDLLGDDHDLAVLRHSLTKDSRGLEGDVDTLLCLAQRRQNELRAEAKNLGACLYAETPKCLTRKIRFYWRAWKA